METEDKNKESGSIKAEQETKLPFLVEMKNQGWPLADDYGKVVIIEREDSSVISRGYAGFNDQKKIILSSSVEKVEAEALDVLAYIKELRKGSKKPR